MSPLSMDWSRTESRKNNNDEEKYDSLKFGFRELYEALFTRRDLAGMKQRETKLESVVLKGCTAH